MVMILQPQPDTQTLRQQAMQSGLNTVMQGLKNYGEAQALQQKMAGEADLTKRQLALKGIEMKVQQGLNLSPEENSFVGSLISGAAPAVQTPQSVAPGSPLGQTAMPSISSVVNQPAQPRYQDGNEDLSMYTPRKQAEIRRQMNQDKLVEAQLADLNKPYAETSKGRSEISKEVATNTPPGFKYTSEGVPSSQDAEAIKKASSAANDMASAVNDLALAVKTYGKSSGTGVTAGGQAVDRAVARTILKVKNAEQLGALSGPDIGLATAAIGKIQGVSAYANQFVSDEEAVSALESIIKNANDRVESEASSRGFSRVKPAPAFKNPYQSNKSAVSQAVKKPEDMTDAELDAYLSGKQK